MGMTNEERFRFDLSGFLVRPAILDAEQIAAIRDQIYRIKHDPISLPPEVLAGLPREKQAYFRPPWVADFRTSPATLNTIERFVAKGEPTVDTVHQP